MCVAARDALQFVGGIPPDVDLDTTLCPAERNVDDGAFVCHQRGERSHLVLVDQGTVTDSPFCRQFVMAMFGAPRVDDFNRAIISFDRECDMTDRIAHFDLIKQPRAGKSVN